MEHPWVRHGIEVGVCTKVDSAPHSWSWWSRAWFLIRAGSSLREHLATSGDILGCPNWWGGCYCLVSRDPGCCSTSCKAQENAAQQGRSAPPHQQGWGGHRRRATQVDTEDELDMTGQRGRGMGTGLSVPDGGLETDSGNVFILTLYRLTVFLRQGPLCLGTNSASWHTPESKRDRSWRIIHTHVHPAPRLLP